MRIIKVTEWSLMINTGQLSLWQMHASYGVNIKTLKLLRKTLWKIFFLIDLTKNHFKIFFLLAVAKLYHSYKPHESYI